MLNFDSILFIGFNSRVAAMDRRTGEIIWQWKAHKGMGYVTILLDGNQLFVSVQGYMYCLDPSNGDEIWFNPMSGFGFGVTSMATVNTHVPHQLIAQAAAAQQQRSSSSSSSTTT